MSDSVNEAPAVQPPGSSGDRAEDRRGWGDYCVPVAIFVFCAVVTYISLQLEEALPLIVGDSMQPRVFPIFLMAVIAVLNIVLILQILRKPVSDRGWEPWQTWASAALMAVFYVLTEQVDMMLALIVCMFSMCLVWGERRLWVAFLVAFGTTAAIFFTFDQVLEVRFPRGLLTDPYYG